MSLVQPAFILRYLLPGAVWRMPASGKTVYITFDDGPVNEVTPYVLEILKHYHVKASFFCIGKNVLANHDVYERIIAEGHAVGNHSYSHLKGWNTSKSNYLQDVQRCAELVESRLFRPPYGKMTPAQFLQLRKDYSIIMWDVLSMDYDLRLTPEQCLENVLNHVRPGSIITFHDSVKAWPRLQPILPVIIEKLLADGYRFATLNADDFSS
jgi:peptidoglycan/xylan/chitin deacetylase (PgdA/CDA1 family)